MANNYLVTDIQLENIANAIRNKSKETEKMGIEDMPEKIANLTGEMLIKPDSYPDYVRQETLRVANLARTKIKEDSIVSICMSDSHYPSPEATRAGAQHALMAAKSLTYLLPVDFIAHLGDIGFEDHNGENIIDVLKVNLEEILPMIKETQQDSIPLFAAIGNHDVGGYVTKDDATDTLESKWPGYMFQHFTGLVGERGVYGEDTTGGGYCYYDISDKKIRIFLLNSCESSVKTGNPDDTYVDTTQQKWLIERLIELNDKTDANEWGFIVLCHFPLDYIYMKYLSNIFKAFIEGKTPQIVSREFEIINGTEKPVFTAINYTQFGETTPYVFEQNKAKFIVQLHGHVHNFLTSQLHDNSNPPQQYDAWRMCIPNIQTDRENYYTTVGDINFQQDTSYLKTPGTAQDVSFVVNVINPSEEMIYSFTYGAGPEMRTIGYDFNRIKYNINFESKDKSISSSNPSAIIYDGSEYRTTLIPIEGYKLTKDTISIKMNGIEIKDEVLNLETGEIIIPKVIGNIEISAYTETAAYYTVTYELTNITKGSTAVDKIVNEGTPSYAKTTFVPTNENLLINPYLTKVTMGGQTIPVELVDNKYEIEISNVNSPIVIHIEAYASNLWKFAESQDSAAIYNNGLGYKDNCRIAWGAQSGDPPTTAVLEGYVTTGLIPYTITPTVLIAGEKDIEIFGVTIDEYLSNGELDSGIRAFAYSSSKSAFSNQLDGNQETSKISMSWEIQKIEDKHYKLVAKPASYAGLGIWNGKTIGYISFSFKGSGKDLVIKTNEITDEPVKLYSITYNLNGLTLSNNVTTIKENEKYYTKLEDSTKYKLDGTPIITMGTNDITDVAWNATTREIIIEKVTGNIMISANSIEVELTYDNLVSEPDLNYGYTDDYRQNSTGTIQAQAGWVTTGFIPWKPGDGTIRLGGDNIEFFETNSSNARLLFYDAEQQVLKSSDGSTFVALQGSGLINAGKLDETENTVFTYIPDNTLTNACYFRITAKGRGENMIVTINQPIS